MQRLKSSLKGAKFLGERKKGRPSQGPGSRVSEQRGAGPVQEEGPGEH